MTEKNSKHLILMSFDNYKLYVKSYKILRSAKVSEMPAFSDSQAFCYMGFGHEQIKVTALIDKSRLNEIHYVLNNYMQSNSYAVEIDGMSIGKCVLTSYEVCGSEDNYIYEVSISMCKP